MAAGATAVEIVAVRVEGGLAVEATGTGTGVGTDVAVAAGATEAGTAGVLAAGDPADAKTGIGAATVAGVAPGTEAEIAAEPGAIVLATAAVETTGEIGDAREAAIVRSGTGRRENVARVTVPTEGVRLAIVRLGSGPEIGSETAQAAAVRGAARDGASGSGTDQVEADRVAEGSVIALTAGGRVDPEAAGLATVQGAVAQAAPDVVTGSVTVRISTASVIGEALAVRVAVVLVTAVDATSTDGVRIAIGMGAVGLAQVGTEPTTVILVTPGATKVRGLLARRGRPRRRVPRCIHVSTSISSRSSRSGSRSCWTRLRRKRRAVSANSGSHRIGLRLRSSRSRKLS